MTIVESKTSAPDRGPGRTDRRALLGGALGLVSLASPLGRARAQSSAVDPALVARQLPLQAVGLEHIGTVVPDVSAAARFFGRLFNPQVYKEREDPLRYYVTLDPGYIALGSRESEPDAFIDHDCVFAEGYDRTAMARRLEEEALPPGRFGIISDPDGLGMQLLPIGGLAGSTEAAGPIVAGPALVRPRGLYRVFRYVSDLDRSIAFYRKFFGPELAGGDSTGVWFQVGPTYFGIEQAPSGVAPRIDRFCVNVAAGGFDPGRLGAALTELGAELRSNPGAELVHFRSPEGIGVELRPVDPARMWGRT